MKRIISLLLAISMLLSFAACGGGEKTYTVTFDTNGGSAVSAQSVKAGECAKEPSAPTKGELYFAGWYADSALTVPYDFGAPVNSDITLYAKWTRYEGTVSASTSSVDTFFITNLIIDKSDMKASATVSAPADCTLLVRFVDEEIYFSDNYPTNKSYISENSLYASCEVKADTDMGTVLAEIVGSLPDYYVAETVLVDENGNALCNPASFIEHTQRYEAYDNTTIHDFADTDTVLQFSDSETSNFGVLSDDIIALNVDSITVIEENFSYQITGMTGSLRSGDKVFLTDKEGTALFLVVKSASSNGAVTQIIALHRSNLSLTDFYKFLKFDRDIVTDAQTADSTMRMPQVKAKNGASASKVIKLDLDPIRFDSANCTITGDISGSISASMKLDYAIHLFGERYFRFDFSYTIKGNAELDIEDKPGMAVEWTEIDLTLGEVKLPLGVPGMNAVAQVNARIAFEADGGVNVFGSFETNQGFRYNTKDGYQTIDKKKASWTMSCEGYGQIAFGPNPVVSIEAFGGAVSCELDSFIGVRGEATISEPAHGGNFYHACNRCADGALYGVVSTDAELEYRLTKKISGKPIDQNIVYVENRLCDFYVSLENDTDSIFGGKVTFGKGECPNWVTNTGTTEPPTEPPLVYSEGLEFALDWDKESYFVSGIGTCTDTDIVIPSTYKSLPVTAVGYQAFSGCSSLTSIIIPDSVTSIGGSAFSGCISLTSITIPDGVTNIDNNTFASCYSLTSITIPDSVTGIEYGAFCNCSSLTSITLPDSVTSIGDNAFRSCSSLTSITLPDGVTSIESCTFEACSSLTSITLPDSVTSIGVGAFSGCSSLTSIKIPDSVTSIGNSAFYDCSSLTSITLPDSVTSIGDSAFSGCSALTSITLPDSVTSIERYTFARCGFLRSITLPDGVTSIGEYAFYFCESLTSITLPDDVTSIGEYAFYSCRSLTSINIPDSVTKIGRNTFYDCASLTSITIPDSVKNIYNHAFASCRSLTSIIIPDGVTSIGSYAFDFCESLTSITIPDSVTSIGENAFSVGDPLTSIHYDGTVEQWRAVEKDNQWNDYPYNYTVYCTNGQVARDGTVTYK